MLAKSGLLDITMKTADLIRSNQQAQNELIQLKTEIEQFTKSVLANPENQVCLLLLVQTFYIPMFMKTHNLLQDKTRSSARSVFLANPLNMEEVPASPKVSVIKMLPSPMHGPS